MRASKPLLFTAAAALMAAGFAAGPAAAQSSVDEVVVQGYTADGPSRISRAVQFDDLDLTTIEGRQILSMRIRDTADDLCRTLGEDPGARSPILGSCRDDALRSARTQMRIAIDTAYADRNMAYLDPSLTP